MKTATNMARVAGDDIKPAITKNMESTDTERPSRLKAVAACTRATSINSSANGKNSMENGVKMPRREKMTLAIPIPKPLFGAL